MKAGPVDERRSGRSPLAHLPLLLFTKLNEPETVAAPLSGAPKLSPFSTPWMQLTTPPLSVPLGEALSLPTDPLPPTEIVKVTRPSMSGLVLSPAW